MLINYQIKSSSFDVAELLTHTHTDIHNRVQSTESQPENTWVNKVFTGHKLDGNKHSDG